jgi:hypothetical protein
LKAQAMEQELMEKLHELIKAKFYAIRSSLPQLQPHDEILHDYCATFGMKLNTIADHEKECRADLPPPGGAMFLPENVVRLRNLWGDKYLDVPEDFAIRALALGFLP